MLKWIRKPNALLLGLCLSCVTLTASAVPLTVGDYSLELPDQNLESLSLQDRALTLRYGGDREVRIKQVSRDQFEERTTIPAAEYLKDLYGDQQPTSTILQVIRDRNNRDVTDKQIETRGYLTFYVLTFPDRSVAYVSDEYQPEYFIEIETRNQPLPPLLKNFSGGKAAGTSAPAGTGQ